MQKTKAIYERKLSKSLHLCILLNESRNQVSDKRKKKQLCVSSLFKLTRNHEEKLDRLNESFCHVILIIVYQNESI